MLFSIVLNRITEQLQQGAHSFARAIVCSLALALALVLALALAPSSSTAVAAETKPQLNAKGRYGQSLSVDRGNIGPDGKITVSGKGFDTTVGLYLSLCKEPPKGRQPTPCGGGMDSTAATGSAIWIANNAPAYAANLIRPFGEGGTFRFELEFQPTFGGVDCRKEKCAITIRADHLRSGDRSHDILIPVTFGQTPAGSQAGSKKRDQQNKKSQKSKGANKSK